MRLPSPNAHWRDSARYPRLFFMDARATFPILLALVHIRLWTLLLALSMTLFFALLHRFGFTINIFGRWVRSVFAGPRKTAYPWWLK